MEFLDAVLGLVAIESVAFENMTETAIYGEGLEKALTYCENLAKELGLNYVNLDNKVAWCEIGEGDEMVAALTHIDIVPLGGGWSRSALGEIDGEYIYGRGVSDDKGPTVAIMYAMHELLQAKTPLKRRIRLILGQTEETGKWYDMDYYREHAEAPVCGFTPDASFPAIFGEKRIAYYTLKMPLATSGLVSVVGGDAANVVAAHCTATYLDKDGKEVTVTTSGVNAHASKPEEGTNAMPACFEQCEGAFAEFFNKHIGYDYNGGKMGCGFKDDESGLLTMNAGKLRVVGDEVVLDLDFRIPVTFTAEQVTEALETASAPYGISVTKTNELDHVYMDKNGKVIKTMVDIFRKHTGDMSEPFVIGGGTYARAMKNVVAFGPIFPGRPGAEHQPDERLLISDLLLAKEIYKETLVELAMLD